MSAVRQIYIAQYSDLPYGYVTKVGTAVTADEAKMNRLTTNTNYTYLTAAVTVTLPVLPSNVAECILRFAEGATKYNVTLALPSGSTVSRYYISGDTVAAGSAATPNQYEMLVQIVPTATTGTYEVISTTRELKTSES